MKPQAVKGTYDVLPDDQPRWRALRAAAETVLERAGVRELRPPIFEHSDIFDKSAGDSSDLVVQKEMFRFTDRGERDLTLRPEFTAGVMRAFIEHGMHVLPTPVKLWSLGPAFRAENVQRGRFRQFHQVNCELLGLDGPLLDAEAIALAVGLLRELGLQDFTVRLGSVGDPADRDRANAYLRERLAPKADALSESSRDRLALNPLRIFDSKDDGDQELIRDLKRPLDFLGDEARAHFDAVRGHLQDWGIDVVIDPAIVRGLDYYRRTAFELEHAGIGSQAVLVGGGRYDGLVESLGGPSTPGVGWALGIERTFDALDSEGVAAPEAPGPLVFLVPLDDDAVSEVAREAQRLRGRVSAEHAYRRRNPGKGLRDADRAGARFAALRGPEERDQDAWQLKDLGSGEQRAVAAADLLPTLERAAAGGAA